MIGNPSDILSMVSDFVWTLAPIITAAIVYKKYVG